MLSPMIMQNLGKLKIERSQLPVLIHNNQVIEGLFTIVGYTCQKYNKLDLYGSNIFIRVNTLLFLDKGARNIANLFHKAAPNNGFFLRTGRICSTKIRRSDK